MILQFSSPYRWGRPLVGRKVVDVVVATVALALALGVLSGCASDGEEDAVTSAEVGVPGAGDRDRVLPTITVGVATWPAAQLNAAIADKLIERRLGYPVEQVPIFDFAGMLSDLERGDLHAVLEVWPESLVERERVFLDDERVVVYGELGVEGRVGWHVPAASASELELDNWEALSDPEVAGAFATGEFPNGRFLGIDPSYDQQDQWLIDELGLPFTVEFSGSEAATVALVDQAVARGEPILFYWWSPTKLSTRHELQRIALPPLTSSCRDAESDELIEACDYPSQQLIKLGSPDLATVAPRVDLALKAFTLTNEDQAAMLRALDEGATVDEATDAWIAENQERWEAWFQ